MTAEEKRCYGCNKPLSKENDSKAHIIPNALGGRLAPKGIICQSCNTTLGTVADNALVEAFGAWPTLLNIPRSHGSNPLKVIETRDGNKVRLEADGSLTKVGVKYDVSEISDGHSVTIGAGDMKAIRQLLNRAAKDFPGFDPVEAKNHAKKVAVLPDDQLKLSLDFSPEAILGGIVSALWLFLIMKTGDALMNWDRLLSCIKEMQANGGAFRYLIDGLPGLKGPEIPLGHKIILRSVPKTGELIAYMEILGVLKVGGIFAKCPPPSDELEYVYVYDVSKKEERSGEFSIDATNFDSQDWRAIGLGPTDTDVESLQDHFTCALKVFVDHYSQRFSA